MRSAPLCGAFLYAERSLRVSIHRGRGRACARRRRPRAAPASIEHKVWPSSSALRAARAERAMHPRPCGGAFSGGSVRDHVDGLVSDILAAGPSERNANMAGFVRRFAVVLAGLTVILTLSALHRALAQTPAAPAKPEMTESCPGLVASDVPRLIPAAFQPTALDPDQVRIIYNGHSTFTIESPQHVRIATDYNDYVSVPGVPDIVTMNHAHDTHYTDHPNPAIKYVLR